jgi:hypothetical protein
MSESKKIRISRLTACLVGFLGYLISTASVWAVVTTVDPVMQELLRQPMDMQRLQKILASGKSPEEITAARLRC